MDDNMQQGLNGAVLAFGLYMEITGVCSALLEASLALFLANPKPANILTFMADEMTAGRPLDGIYPQIAQLATERDAFLQYLATTNLFQAMTEATVALFFADPKPEDPVVFFAQFLRDFQGPPPAEFPEN
jgi:hypothetical protein